MKTLDEVVRYADSVHGYMFKNELMWLAQTARELDRPAAWCEIGSWQGRSASAVAGGLTPGSSLTLVDNFSGPTTREMPDKKACERTLKAAVARMNAEYPGVAISLHIGESDLIATTMPRAFFDVIFIDGDHKYEKVKADILAWMPTMRPGGLMCGHDFTNKCGVEPAVRELLPGFGQVKDSSIWFVRV
jgi:predicted O-methyltransferase YrrM